jgi:PAS domain S-box-containing protein
MKAAIGKTLMTGVALAIAALISIGVLSIWQSRRLQDSSFWVQHTDRVLFQAREAEKFGLLADLNNQRFLLSHDRVYLDSTLHNKTRLDTALTGLQVLTRDNPLQQNRIDSLRHHLYRGIFAPEARQVLESILSEERSLLDFRREANARITADQQTVLWILIGILVVLALVLFQTVRQDIAIRRRTAERLHLFNTALGAKVVMQTGELEDSKEKYKTLFYKSPLPKWIYDQDTLQFLEVNEAAVRHYGYSQAEFLRMKISDIRPPEDREKLEKNIESLTIGEETYREKDWRHIRKDGQVIYVEITAHPIEYDGRKARMVVVNDITQRRDHELALQQLNEDLEKRAAELSASNAELERFAYIASHDLQEPLRMVSSFLQLLKKRYGGQLDERADQYIHYAVDGSDRMKALISDLLEYSRVGSGREGFGVVDMTGVLRDVNDIFREKIQATHAVLDVGDMPEVWGERVQLAQLLQNLVGNALKYHSERDPLIRVRAQEEVLHWRFSVEDNGIGIDPTFFDKIFIIFQRLHNKNDYSGTGIGLAICKKIVERHWGRIWVESVPGKGSIFYFTIHKHI